MVAAASPPPRHRHRADAAAEEWARHGGVSKLELTSSPTTAGDPLYEKLGYEREGLRRGHYASADGGHSDVVLMAKQL